MVKKKKKGKKKKQHFKPTFPFSDISRQYHRCRLVKILIGRERQDRDKGDKEGGEKRKNKRERKK